MKKKAADWREARRLEAYDLHLSDVPQVAIARRLGVTEGAVSQWIKRAREGGRDALLSTPHTGRPPDLPLEEAKILIKTLQSGAEAFGFVGEIWTRGRVADVVFRLTGRKFHVTQMGRILAAAGWTRQKPAKRSIHRDEKAIESWRKNKWPQLKKGRKPKGEQSSS